MSSYNLSDLTPIIGIGSFFLAVLGLVVAIIISIFRLSRFSFIATEEKFDNEYFEKRKKLGLDSKYIFYPLRFIHKTKFKDLSFVRNSSVKWDWYSKVNDWDAVSAHNPFLAWPVFPDFIHEMFVDLKNPNSQLHEKLFEPKPIKLDLFRDKEGYELETMVKNILNEIPTPNLLSFPETARIAALLNEAAVNGIAKNPENYKRFIELGKKGGIENPEEKIKKEIFPLGTFEQIKIFLEGLGNNLNIQITVYDARMNAPVSEHQNFIVESRNPIKEYTVLILDKDFYFLSPSQ